MNALVVNEGFQILKKRDHITNHAMYKNRCKFLNNVVLTKVTDFFYENIKYSRNQITMMMQSVLKTRCLNFENRGFLERAVDSCRQSNGTLSECIHGSVNKAYDSTERHVHKMNYTELLTNLRLQPQPGEAKIRSLAPSNLPIQF